MTLKEQEKLESRYVMHTFARKPVEFVSGKGMYLYDDQSHEYLDFLSGIGVVALGHCAPCVTDAVQAQASRLVHVGNYYYVEQRGQVAQTISDILNAEVQHDKRTDWKSFFANSGAEANECAIKIARLHGRLQAEEKDAKHAQLIITLEGSFHGRTLATLAATAQPAKQEIFQPLPQGFIAIPPNDVAALEVIFAKHGDEICAVMLECVQGESGIHPCTEEFLTAARQLTTKNNALLICDEVQSGCYRSGKPFAFQHFNVLPDVVTIAKGIANGFPAGICAAHGKAADIFSPGDHGSTFGGSCIAIAAAAATLTEMQNPDFATQISYTGGYLKQKLSDLPQVKEVRGLGLMVGADLTDDAPSAPEIVTAALNSGLIINATGEHTLRFLPPLICQPEHVDAMIERLAPLLVG